MYLCFIILKHKKMNQFNESNKNQEILDKKLEYSLWTDIDEFVIHMKQKYNGKIKSEKIMELINEYIND